MQINTNINIDALQYTHGLKSKAQESSGSKVDGSDKLSSVNNVNNKSISSITIDVAKDVKSSAGTIGTIEAIKVEEKNADTTSLDIMSKLRNGSISKIDLKGLNVAASRITASSSLEGSTSSTQNTDSQKGIGNITGRAAQAGGSVQDSSKDIESSENSVNNNPTSDSINIKEQLDKTSAQIKESSEQAKKQAAKFKEMLTHSSLKSNVGEIGEGITQESKDLKTESEAFLKGRSTIMDADVDPIKKYNVLQQASVSAIAQANQPQNQILKLLS